MVPVIVLADWLAVRLQVGALEDVPVVFRSGGQVVRAVAFGLDPEDVPVDVVAEAVFLHRPFRAGGRFAGRTVLASHAGFDALLTTGVNRPLAERLGWVDVRSVVHDGRELGLLARVPRSGWSALLSVLREEFGGWEQLLDPAWLGDDVTVALMSACRPELVSLVAQSGAGVYVTGQWRPGAQLRARELGVGIVAVGHRRSEQWGVRQLAREVSAAFPSVRVSVFEGGRPDARFVSGA